MPKLTKRILDAAKPKDTEQFLWCSATPGFGIRIYPSGNKVFIAQVRMGRRQRRVKLGNFGTFTVDQARRKAVEVIRAAFEGRDPQREKRDAREALTVSELCDEYLEHARAGQVLTRFRRPKRPSTIAIDEGRVSRHIKPLIGNLPARDLKRSDVQRMVDAITQGKTAGTFEGARPRGRAVVTGGAGTAARVSELLGGIWSWAEKRGYVEGPSPTCGVETARGEAKDRVLDDKELKSLGKALINAMKTSPMAANAVHLIALTGLRRAEASGLRWEEIDEINQCLRLANTKTGRSTRPIGRDAIDLLLTLPRLDETWVFPNRIGTGGAEIKKPIAGIFNAAGLNNARAHDLRRTFASIAADEGYSDATIGELLGHARRGVTARHYIRRPDAALVATADCVSARISSAIKGDNSQAKVVTFDPSCGKGKRAKSRLP